MSECEMSFGGALGALLFIIHHSSFIIHW